MSIVKVMKRANEPRSHPRQRASRDLTLWLNGCWMTSSLKSVRQLCIWRYAGFLFIVTVPPQLLIPHQLVSVPRGSNVTLECFTEAHPTSLNYWTRGDSQMLHDSKKYRSENVPGSPSFKIHMKLTIFNVNDDDLGQYKCVAKNPRGETDGSIRIYSEYTSSVFGIYACRSRKPPNAV